MRTSDRKEIFYAATADSSKKIKQKHVELFNFKCRYWDKDASSFCMQKSLLQKNLILVDVTGLLFSLTENEEMLSWKSS